MSSIYFFISSWPSGPPSHPPGLARSLSIFYFYFSEEFFTTFKIGPRQLVMLPQEIVCKISIFNSH